MNTPTKAAYTTKTVTIDDLSTLKVRTDLMSDISASSNIAKLVVAMSDKREVRYPVQIDDNGLRLGWITFKVYCIQAEDGSGRCWNINTDQGMLFVRFPSI